MRESRSVSVSLVSRIRASNAVVTASNPDARLGPMRDPHVERALAALHNTKAILERVIERATELSEKYPDRRPFAERQIIDAEREIALADAEIAALEAGGTLDDVISADERGRWTEATLRNARERIQPDRGDGPAADG
jgi:hypothetical protein